jgi:hypothetical protein
MKTFSLIIFISLALVNFVSAGSSKENSTIKATGKNTEKVFKAFKMVRGHVISWKELPISSRAYIEENIENSHITRIAKIGHAANGLPFQVELTNNDSEYILCFAANGDLIEFHQKFLKKKPVSRLYF